jgi:hypothetical protein
MSAVTPIADKGGRGRIVRFVPKADISQVSLYDFVCSYEYVRRNCETETCRRLLAFEPNQRQRNAEGGALFRFGASDAPDRHHC